MAELDIEKLRQLRDRRWEPGLTEPAAIGELQAALPTIIEVWEDCDRLRAEIRRYFECPFEDDIAEQFPLMNALLEGRDG